MAQASALNLLVEEGRPVSFRCEIHGTVTRCPWRFMDCTVSDAPDLTSKRHLPPEVLEALAEYLERKATHGRD